MSTEIANIEDIGVDVDEMDEYMASLKTGIGIQERQVCICGHALVRHTKGDVAGYCNYGKAWCDCTEPIPVLDPDDLRPFVYSTTGVGKKHALAKALYTLRKNGKSARWLIERVCFRCGSEGQTVFPTALTRDKRIARGSGYTNALLCRECVEALGGYPGYY